MHSFGYPTDTNWDAQGTNTMYSIIIIHCINSLQYNNREVGATNLPERAVL